MIKNNMASLDRTSTVGCWKDVGNFSVPSLFYVLNDLFIYWDSWEHINVFCVERWQAVWYRVSSSDQYISIKLSGLLFKFDYSTWVSWVELLWIFCSKYFIQLSSAHWTVRILQNFNTNVFPISKAKGCYKKLKPYLEKKCPCMELLHLPHRRKDRISEGVGENVQDIQGVLLYRIYKKYVFHGMYICE